jgi:phosphoenolpyruvate carboxylase
MKKVNISHVSNQHNYWLRSLNFYKTEISILKGILTEIAGKNSGTDVLKEVEHFENQFKIQNINIDRLSHEIHVNIDGISKQAQQHNAGYIDESLQVTHIALGERFENEEKIIHEIIRTFRKFAEQWM